MKKLSEKFIPINDIHRGHRSRMREKFIKYGADVFETYELLEILLYNSIASKDTNPVAKRLLTAFKTLDGVLSAELSDLVKTDGLGPRSASVIKAASLVPEILKLESASKLKEFLTYSSAANYFINYFSGADGYKISMLLLDNDMLPIKIVDLYDKDFQSGGVNSHPFVTEAIKARASAVIIAHNHPFGPSFPGEGDRSTNQMVRKALSDVDVLLVEHYVVCGSQAVGFVDHSPETIDSPTVYEFVKSKLCSSLCVCADKLATGGRINTVCVERAVNMLSPVCADNCIDTVEKLYRRYQTMDRIFSLTYNVLAEEVGEKCAFYIKLLAALTSRRVKDLFEEGRAYSIEGLADYFKALFIGDSEEKIYLVSCDFEGRVLACDLAAHGTSNISCIIPRQLVEIAVYRKACRVILAHNHPCGNAFASKEDNDFTEALCRVFESAGIDLVLHYIVAGTDSTVISKRNFCEERLKNPFLS